MRPEESPTLNQPDKSRAIHGRVHCSSSATQRGEEQSQTTVCHRGPNTLANARTMRSHSSLLHAAVSSFRLPSSTSRRWPLLVMASSLTRQKPANSPTQIGAVPPRVLSPATTSTLFTMRCHSSDHMTQERGSRTSVISGTPILMTPMTRCVGVTVQRPTPIGWG